MTVIQEVTTSKEEVKERGRIDFNFFASLCMPAVMVYPFPTFYLAVWKMLVSESDPVKRARILRFALGLPRGFVKTTFIKILVSWFILYDRASFILIIGATEFHAENILTDIHDILSSPNIESVYGSWTRGIITDTKAVKTSSARRDDGTNRVVIIAALGAGSSLRGLNIKNRRPDFVICDDMQTEANDASEAESKYLFSWFIGTLLKAVDPTWCLVVYIGNMYSENCILYKLKIHPLWKSLITGCILADGKSLWPELHPVEALFDSFKHDELVGKANIWFAELMNDPIEARISILPEGALKPCPYDTTAGEPDGSFLTVDPAGFRSASDENVISVHYTYDQKGVVAEMAGGRWDPERTVKEIIRLAMLHGCSLVGIEATGYQQTLAFWLEHYMKLLSLTGEFEIIPLESKKRSKESRIKTFIRECAEGNYFFAREEDRQKVVYQALGYKMGKKNNKDDRLDCPAYALDIRQEYWDKITYKKRERQTSNEAYFFSGNNAPF